MKMRQIEEEELGIVSWGGERERGALSDVDDDNLFINEVQTENEDSR